MATVPARDILRPHNPTTLIINSIIGNMSTWPGDIPLASCPVRLLVSAICNLSQCRTWIVNPGAEEKEITAH